MPVLKEVDLKKQDEGVWIDTEEGISVKIARWGNKSFNEYLDELMKPLRKTKKRGLRRGNPLDILGKGVEFKDGEAEKIMIQATARDILVDWKNMERYKLDKKGEIVEDKDGKPVLEAIKYSVAEAETILSDPKRKPFYEGVVEFAKDLDNYEAEEMEAAEGNLGSSSAGG